MSNSEAPSQTNAALVAEAASRLSGAAPEAILGWALNTFPRERIAICSSLQDEGVITIEMATRIDPQVGVFTIDTGRLPAATLDLMDEVRDRYGVRLEVLFPDATEVTDLVSEHGVNLMYRSTELRLSCCDVRKARPLARKLRGLDAWITGLRQDQNESRAGTAVVEVDELHGGMVKVNPLAEWTQEQVAAYVAEHKVPRNSLYRKGYTSIGCDPCTRATEPGEDPRAGRWWWESGDDECGLHYEMVTDADGHNRVVATADVKVAGS